jgi:hypothetical protein
MMFNYYVITYKYSLKLMIKFWDWGDGFLFESWIFCKVGRLFLTFHCFCLIIFVIIILGDWGCGMWYFCFVLFSGQSWCTILVIVLRLPWQVVIHWFLLAVWPFLCDFLFFSKGCWTIIWILGSDVRVVFVFF